MKGITATAEVILGILFLTISSQTVNKVIFFIFGDELMEQPRDPIWNFFLHGFNGLSTSVQHFWAFIFIAHGVVIMFLIVGLVKEKFWVYPIAAVIFICLAAYQIFHIIYAPSLILSVLTTLDILFIWLIIQEYKYQKEILLKSNF